MMPDDPNNPDAQYRGTACLGCVGIGLLYLLIHAAIMVGVWMIRRSLPHD
jgi:hypothetical protein